MYDLRYKHVLFTGELNSLTRKQAQQLASSLGAFPVSNVSKQVNFVIAGQISKGFNQELTTKKLQYAQAHNIPILNEQNFLVWCAARMTRLSETLK